MGKAVYKIDANGFYIEPVIIDDNEPLPKDCIETKPTQLYKAKWDGSKWVEGATQDEINKINTPSQVPQPSETDQLKQQLLETQAQLANLQEQVLLNKTGGK